MIPRLLLALSFLLGAAFPAAAAERLTVLLDWFVNPDHGPLVIAREKGFFREAGLEVELVAPADPNDPPKLVAAGKADIAIGYQPQLHLQVHEGLPLVRIGTLVATPLNSLVFLEGGPVRAVADLRGRKVGYSVGGFEEALLGAMLERHGLRLSDVRLVNVNFALSAALLSGQVDAVIGAFRNFELAQLALEGRPGRAFFPEEEGVPAYDELVYLVHRDRLDRPELVRFLDAVERATFWILNRPEEAWAVFSGTAKELQDELNRRAWAATLPRFAHAPAALDTARYARFAAFLHERKLIGPPPAVSTYAVDLGARRR
ncbi:MAG: ABC transporter substrate-binding protein [Geminicoccaceae bacterium]|nr:ABC transporter substrate-binding protein [Geminicoccaceae bacterium]MCX8101534.1 ABC transporter substrate-binding protein [Geminicoccaceae bacterium]MDW8370880.1 ABC transporter substrate-binding protein [Geminicoccaceae bacterium]